MSTTDYNGYIVDGDLTTKNSGFSRWGFATKGGKDYFVKEFLSPVYPEDTTMFTEKQLKSKIDGCLKFEADKRRLYREINEASNGNIEGIQDFFRCGTKYYIITDKVIAMKLEPKKVAALPYEQRELLCKILAHSMMSLHKKNVVHADIKWDNILFAQSHGRRKIVAKLIDFDNSFFSNEPPEEPDDLNVDWVYCAPEAYLFIDEEDVVLDEKIDVYAMGVIFHQIMTGEMPKFSDEYQYLCDAQLNGDTVKLSNDLNPQMCTLIESMLEKEPEKRADSETVFKTLCPQRVESVECEEHTEREERIVNQETGERTAHTASEERVVNSENKEHVVHATRTGNSKLITTFKISETMAPIEEEAPTTTTEKTPKPADSYDPFFAPAGEL